MIACVQTLSPEPHERACTQANDWIVSHFVTVFVFVSMGLSLTLLRILHFTVLCLVAKPLNRSEATGDFVVIQTLQLFVCKSLCYHANYFCISIISRSPPTSLSYKGLVTLHTTVKWSIEFSRCCSQANI